MSNNKANITDFFVQLQQIDFARILMLLSPTIIYYTARKPISSNYNLRKDFKIKNVNTASLPVEVVRKFDDINEEEILKKQFGQLIMEFVEVVKENIPEINLTLFLNNINTLNSSIKDFKFSNFISNGRTAGAYDPEKNTIELSKNNYSLTIDHELFHASSTIVDEATGMIYCGFQQITNKNQKIGEGLNEGYTQYLTEKYFGNKRPLLYAYTYEKRIAEIMEIIIGQEQMQTLYFNANLKGLIDCLKQYHSEEEVYKFINTLDFLNKHIQDKYLLPSSNEIILNGIKFINSFLIQTILRKAITDNTENQISVEEVFNRLVPILTLIPSNVKFNNKSYVTSNDELIKDAISFVMSDYKLSEDKKTISK